MKHVNPLTLRKNAADASVQGLPLFPRLWAIATASMLLTTATQGAQLSTVLAWGVENDSTFVPGGLTNVVGVAAGTDYSLALRDDGTLVGWGYCAPCQTGIAGISNVAAVSAGFRHVLALQSNGTVIAWGENASGETDVPGGLTGVVAVAAGFRQSLALKNDGTLVSWGREGSTNLPAGLSGVVAIAANSVWNYARYLALKNDGTVFAWGESYFGENEVPPGLSNVIAVAMGAYHNLALKSDGTVVAWGGDSDPGVITPPSGLSNVVAIAAGYYHNFALKNDGTVVAWTSSKYFDWHAAEVPESLTNVVAIAAGEAHSLAVSVMTAPLIRVQPLSASVFASSEDSFLLFVLADGLAPLSYQWLKAGVSIPGATNAGLPFPGVQASDAGIYSVVVSNAGGSVTSQPATLTVLPFLRITAQPKNWDAYVGEDATFTSHAKGSLPISYQWSKDGSELAGQTDPILTLSNVQSNDAGNYTVVVTNIVGAITSVTAKLTVSYAVSPVISLEPVSYTVFAGAKVGLRAQSAGARPLAYQWRKDGTPITGATGEELLFNSAQPSDAGDYTTVVSNTYGSATSVVATLTITSGTPWNFPPPGTVVSLGGPLLPQGLTNIIAIAAGGAQNAALRSDRTVVRWSSFSGMELTVPGDLTNVVGIASGLQSWLALKADGTVLRGGVTAVPGLYGVVAIAANPQLGAGDYILALKADGTLVTAGNGPPAPEGASNVVAIAVGPSSALALQSDGTAIGREGWPGPTWFISTTGAVAIAAGTGGGMALRNDGTVIHLEYGPLPGLTNVVAIASGTRQSLALKADGTLISWGATNFSITMSNVSALSVGFLQSLVLTSDPPAPMLAAEGSSQGIVLSAPVAVSGFVLEATDDLSRPYAVVNLETNMAPVTMTNSSGYNLPASGASKFFRLRRL